MRSIPDGGGSHLPERTSTPCIPTAPRSRQAARHFPRQPHRQPRLRPPGRVPTERAGNQIRGSPVEAVLLGTPVVRVDPQPSRRAIFVELKPTPASHWGARDGAACAGGRQQSHSCHGGGRRLAIERRYSSAHSGAGRPGEPVRRPAKGRSPNSRGAGSSRYPACTKPSDACLTQELERGDHESRSTFAGARRRLRLERAAQRVEASRRTTTPR